MSDPIVVDPQKVLERLVRDPLGAAMWRACLAEERADLLEARLAAVGRTEVRGARPATPAAEVPDVRPVPRADRPDDDPPIQAGVVTPIE